MGIERRQLCVSLGALAALGLALPARATEETATAWKELDGRELIRRKYFPNVRLQTHTGRQVRLYEDLIKGKTVLINFMYMNCSDGTCPVTSYNLSQVQPLLKERLGRDVFIYSITLDPENDSVELLDRYAKSFHAQPGWIFLRTDPKSTELIRRSMGFYDRRDAKKDANKANHVSMIRYGNEPSVQWAMTSATAPPGTIARAVMTSMSTAPQARPGILGF